MPVPTATLHDTSPLNLRLAELTRRIARHEEAAANVRDTVVASDTPRDVPWPKTRTAAVESPPAPPPEASPQLETLGRMTASVVHDLNNLLAVIGGHAELLAEWLPPGSVGKQYTDVIRSSVKHASTLTHRVLNFAKPTEMLPASFDLGTVIAELEPLIRASAGPRVECAVTLGEDLPTVWAGRGQIEQVLLNLVSNARDAMPDGGVLGIRTAGVTVRPGRAGWPVERLCGPYVCLTVTDNGRGMDDPTLARLFDPFFTTKGDAGTGLGLATVRDIVGRCHGQIEVESQPDRGSVFRVYFPAFQDSDGDTDPFLELPAMHHGESALLVDDDDDVRAVAKAALETVGYNVIEARTGDEAAKLARVVQEPIDLLVADVVMPGLSGRKLAERLRCSRPGLPVVYISGYPQHEIERGTRVVAKPFMAEQLLTAVQKVTQLVATA